MSEPYWLQLARFELQRGVYEIIGPASLPRIEEYQATCTLWPHSDDAIPWCSSFVNWCVEGGDQQANLANVLLGTKSAAARSWLGWGVSVRLTAHIPIGAVMISKRGRGPQPGPEILDAPGHVTFYAGMATPLHFLGVGGNQSNMVRASIYPLSKVLDARWAM